MLRAINLEAILPRWARRENAVVRRHLGFAGRTNTIDIRRILIVSLLEATLVALTWPLGSIIRAGISSPHITLVVLPLLVVAYGYALAAVLILPLGLLLYAYIMAVVSQGAVDHIFDERQGDTLTLLRTIPPPLQEIFLSKIASSIWRQVDNLDIVLWVITVFSLPIIILYNTFQNQVVSPAPLSQIMVIIALAVCLIRPFVELFMVGALGILSGAAVSFRIAGNAGTILLTISYFALINLVRLLPLSPFLRLAVEYALPLLLPVGIGWAALHAAEYLVTRAEE